jgi:plasmid stabilization system protein ParE
MIVSYHPKAADEYDEAIDYYEDCQAGLGKQFTQEIDASIKLILAFPTAWTLLEGEIRRILIRRFPFGLLYISRDDEIYILAVMNLNRNPNYWKERT